MIEEVCMIAITDVNHDLRTVITISRLESPPSDVCSCQTASSVTVHVNATCIGLRTICSTTRISF